MGKGRLNDRAKEIFPHPCQEGVDRDKFDLAARAWVKLDPCTCSEAMFKGQACPPNCGPHSGDRVIP